MTVKMCNSFCLPNIQINNIDEDIFEKVVLMMKELQTGVICSLVAVVNLQLLVVIFILFHFRAFQLSFLTICNQIDP